MIIVRFCFFGTTVTRNKKNKQYKNSETSQNISYEEWTVFFLFDKTLRPGWAGLRKIDAVDIPARPRIVKGVSWLGRTSGEMGLNALH